MKVYGPAIALVALIATFCACGKSNKNSDAGNTGNTSQVSSENPNSAKTNVEELGLLVNVPSDPDDVVWKEDAAHKRLAAVLHYSKADADRITADAAARSAAQSVTIPSESWFPPELIAQGETSGEDALRGSAYSADDFFMEPYTSGRIVRIAGTDYFVLQLTAK